MKSRIWLYVISVATLFMTCGCSKDEPTPDFSLLEAEYWGNETPHCFIDGIDSIYIPQKNADGFITHIVVQTGNETIYWPGEDFQSSVRFFIYLVPRKKITPISDRKRYVEICRTFGARPRSRRVNLPEINDLPQFLVKQEDYKQIIVPHLEKVDLITHEDLADPKGVKAGDKVEGMAKISGIGYQNLITEILKSGESQNQLDDFYTGCLFHCSVFNTYTTNGLLANKMEVIMPARIANKGDHSFTLIFHYKNHNPVSVTFKIRFGNGSE